MPKILIAVSIVALVAVLVYSFLKTPPEVTEKVPAKKVVRRAFPTKPAPEKTPDVPPQKVPEDVEKPPSIPETVRPVVAGKAVDEADTEPSGKEMAAISYKVDHLKSRVESVETRMDDLEKIKEGVERVAEQGEEINELKDRVDRVEASVASIEKKGVVSRAITAPEEPEDSSREIAPKVSKKKVAKVVKKKRRAKRAKKVRVAGKAPVKKPEVKEISLKKKPEAIYATSGQSLYQISQRFTPIHGLSAREQRSLNKLAPGIAVYPNRYNNRTSRKATSF